MNIEIPEFKRCCCCIPLRYGLLLWSYFLLFPLFDYATKYVINAAHITKQDIREHWTEAALYTVGSLILIINIGLTLLFIVAAHMKSLRLLRIYYKYAIFIAIATFGGEMLWLANTASYYTINRASPAAWKYLILRFFFELVIFGVKLYVLWLVRSEIRKLENNQKFQFSNIAAEAENAHQRSNNAMIELENH